MKIKIGLCLILIGCAGATKSNNTVDGTEKLEISRITSGEKSGLLEAARLIPNIVPNSGGRVGGFTVVSIERESYFDKLGLKRGDLILSINDVFLSSPKILFSASKVIRDGSLKKIEIERDHKEIKIFYEYKN